jgi:hypothetical protein
MDLKFSNKTPTVISPKRSPSTTLKKRKIFKSENVKRIFKSMLKKNIDFDYDTEKLINEDGMEILI